MNKYVKYTFAALSLAIATTGCSDFGDTNIDPEHMNETNLPYEMVFSNAQHQALGSDWDVWRAGLIYCGQWMNHVASINQWWRSSIYTWDDGQSSSYWEIYHSDRGAVRDITLVLDKWKDDPKHEIDYNLARVVRVYIMHRMTDLYGDVPYFEAGRYNQYLYPKYDKQKDIYMDMLKELDEAQANFTKNAEMGKQDLYFGGDAASWKRFANSLMLRLAMRLVKVDGATAKTYVAKAVAGGLITKNDENVILQHPGGSVGNDSAEPYAKIFVNGESVVNFFLHKTFVEMLKNDQDPRLHLIAAVYDTTPEEAITSDKYQKDGNYEVNKQQGLPGGLSNNNESAWFIGKKQEYHKFSREYYPNGDEGQKAFEDYIGKGYRKEYSLPNRYTYSDPTAPTFIVTYAQTEFLLAEATIRGYINGGNSAAEDHFKKGLQAALEQFKQFPNAKELYERYIEGDINRFVNANSLDTSSPEAALEQINTQYWINCFCDEYETYANWRRTGYPILASNYDPNNPEPLCDTKEINGDIARRLRYPTNESQINADNYEDAKSGLEYGDDFSSRVWWDVE